MDDRDTIQRRTREAAHLQLIAGNPFDADDIAMFEMFERKEFSTEQALAYIIEELKERMAAKAQSASPLR
jgi:hypothetical protein